MGASLTISRAPLTQPNIVAANAMMNRYFCASLPESGLMNFCSACASPPFCAAKAMPRGLLFRKNATFAQSWLLVLPGSSGMFTPAPGRFKMHPATLYELKVPPPPLESIKSVSYTHLRAHETRHDLV